MTDILRSDEQTNERLQPAPTDGGLDADPTVVYTVSQDRADDVDVILVFGRPPTQYLRTEAGSPC